MRRLIICFAGFLSLSIPPVHLEAQSAVIPGIADLNQQLPWMQNYQEALKRAAAEKKPVLIDVTTDWCGWSKKMDRETMSNPDVQAMLRRFVLVRLNPELSKENEKVSDDFGVTGFPHFVIANYKGEDIGHLDGYAEKKDLVEFIQKYEEPFKNSPLGYQSVELASTDVLFKAIKRIPQPESRPTSVGSFIILDQCDVRLETNGMAKFVSRTATYVADPEKNDLPTALQFYNSSREKVKFKSVRVLDLNGHGREIDLNLAKDEHAYDNQNVYWDATLTFVVVETTGVERGTDSGRRRGKGTSTPNSRAVLLPLEYGLKHVVNVRNQFDIPCRARIAKTNGPLPRRG